MKQYHILCTVIMMYIIQMNSEQRYYKTSQTDYSMTKMSEYTDKHT